jgi:adenosylcobinamide kinase / adenosylcobinamide-phosphate guanylyltransferase
MGTLILVLGGISSGKSAFAEALVSRHGKAVLYIATGSASDAEMEERIQRHRARRPAEWQTLETGTSPDFFVGLQADSYCAVLLDSVSAWLAGMLTTELDKGGEPKRGTGKSLEEPMRLQIGRLLDWSRELPVPLVLVSDEVGFSLVSPTPVGRLYQELLGTANQAIAGRADDVYLVAAGLPLQLKGRVAPAEPGGSNP